jgi:MSHA biogenesis protein MshQ
MKRIVLLVLMSISFVVSAATTTTYDFSVRTPSSNIFAYYGTDSSQLPSNNSSPSLEFTSSDYVKIESNNNVYHDFINSTKNFYPAKRYVIQLDEVANTITELNVFWNGYGVNSKSNKTDGVAIYIWNNNTNSYDYVTGVTSDWVVELDQSITSSITNYIDNNNQVTVYVTSQEKTFNNETNWIGTDYFRLSVSASSVVVPANIIAEYRFDETSYDGSSNEVIDTVGGFHGRAISSQPISGKVCNAVDLSANGTSDYLILDEDILTTKTDFTVSLWAKTPKNSNQSALSGAGSGSYNELIMWFTDSTSFVPHLQGSTNSTVSITSISDDNWHHLVWTRSGSQNCLHRDNVLQGCTTLSTSPLNIQSLILGQEQDSIGGGFDSSQGWEGLIDEVLVFDSAISNSDISQIYNNQNAGLGYDGSTRICSAIPIANFRLDECAFTGDSGDTIDQMGNYSATSQSGVSSLSVGVVENAADIYQYGHHFTTSISVPSSFSISTWFKKPTSTLDSQYFVLGAMQSGGDLLYVDRGDSWRWGVYDGSSYSNGSYSFSSLDNNWHHLIAVYSGSQTQLYIDGTLVDTINKKPSGTLQYIGTSIDSLGSASAQGFRASLDEFMVFDIALSSAQITTIYNNQLTGDNYDGTSRAAVVCNYQPIVDYRFDECIYTGSGAEIIDQTGIYYASISGVNKSADDAQINKSLDLSATSTTDWVALPSSVIDGLNDFTLSVWVNADNDYSQQEIFHALGNSTSDDELEVYLIGETDVYVKIQDLNKTLQGSITLTDGQWHHLLVTRVSDQVCLYVDGSNQDCDTGVGGGQLSVPNSNSVIIGQEQDSYGGSFSSSQSFKGLMDEFKIYNQALSSAEITALYTNELAKNNYDGTSRAVVDCNTIDHYQIIHDGNGLTCDTEKVTIKACTNTFDLNGSCTLSTNAVTLDVIATGGATVTNSLTFTGTGEVNLAYTTAESVALSLDNISIIPSNTNVCNDNSAGSCNILFANAGFRFLSGTSGTSEVIANQIAGTSFPLRLQAVENSDGVCTGLFTGNVDVKLAQENLDPIGTTGLKFNVNGSDIDKYPSISTQASLNFGSDSIATIPSAYYKDAGQIRLQASYIDSGVTLVGSSQNFWVSPNALVITAQSSGSNIDGATASSTTVHKAGEDFDLVVTAYNSLGTVDGNITKNYQQGQMQLKLTRVKPTITGSVDGGLTYASGNVITSGVSPVFADHALTSFSDGKSTFSNAQFAEVGIINLDVQDINYGSQGLSIAATDITIGRFTPNHFEQTVQAGGSFLSTCNLGSTTFAYSGQKDDATQTQGTISYLSNPVLKIIAKNAAGATVQNYYQDSEDSADDFMKLAASEINITAPSIDSSNKGIDLSSLPISSAMSTGILSQTVTRGELEYKFSDSDRFYYQRSSNTLVTPFISDIDFTVASVISVSDDNISATTTNNVTSTAGIDIHFGRLVLENTFGPETSNLPLVLKTEYFNGSNFVSNTDDRCTAFNPTKVSLTNLGLDPALSAVIGASGTFVDGFANDISLQATGTNNLGDIGIDYDTFEWLKFKWNNTDENNDLNFYDDDPSAVATFGVYRGNDRIISWREVGN